ncbi:hypothetical protein AOL_s00091g53 [Orbilia oligospora ATCC 24927]|uniref:Uncharacterized protein n=1 Tax=Arthrobotrys oligospora (strain ATCC 24927 / CBS 115.81 / DSM 1491) TaxID=756982 RepID=G1XI01_ARTOA|nr:hypothetical protein AOL_s00091g53 [Orbilia oligospora ATCC 24927]EGX47232.1 hypothetical protein AOL_s00091g53 [Orbilia oligospora ATCC 24927]
MKGERDVRLSVPSRLIPLLKDMTRIPILRPASHEICKLKGFWLTELLYSTWAQGTPRSGEKVSKVYSKQIRLCFHYRYKPAADEEDSAPEWRLFTPPCPPNSPPHSPPPPPPPPLRSAPIDLGPCPRLPPRLRRRNGRNPLRPVLAPTIVPAAIQLIPQPPLSAPPLSSPPLAIPRLGSCHSLRYSIPSPTSMATSVDPAITTGAKASQFPALLSSPCRTSTPSPNRNGPSEVPKTAHVTEVKARRRCQCLSTQPSTTESFSLLPNVA